LPVIVIPQNPSATETFAAQEIRRYLYLRTGKLVETQCMASPHADAAMPSNAIVLSVDSNLPAEAFSLKTADNRLHISGGSAVAALYGSYRFAEHLGVRFYLHGDVAPDERIKHFELPLINETHTPRFAVRGLNPFHDFPEGPDWWTLNEYKAILAQMPKMGMNFIGFHTYPERNTAAGPEALVWIGLKDDIDAQGNVTAAYPNARHYYTTLQGCGFNYVAKKTGESNMLSAALTCFQRMPADRIIWTTVPIRLTKR
jgi:hypothetical protein